MAGTSNDFIQIAYGGAAIVEPQAEWEGETGIFLNGFPTGIVLQEQYNKAWRQATAWMPAWGWHSLKIGTNYATADDGIWQNLWFRIIQTALRENSYFSNDASGPNIYIVDNPDPANLGWISGQGANIPAQYGSTITLITGFRNTGVPCYLDFFNTGFQRIYRLDLLDPAPGEIYISVDLVWLGDAWYITSSSPASIKANSFGVKVDTLSTPGVGNYTVPPNCNLIQAILIGSGGGSMASIAATNGSSAGGGGGGCVITPPLVVEPGQVIGYEIGVGGAPSEYGFAGGNGGPSIFASYYYASGGSGGSNSSIGFGGTAFNGFWNLPGSPGSPYGSSNIGSTGGVGGTAAGPYGGAGGSASTGIAEDGHFPGGGAGGPASGGALPGYNGGGGCIYVLR